MEKKRKSFKERTLWIVVTAFLAAVIVLISFAPKVLAGNQEAETQRLLGTFFEVFRFVQENYVDESKADPNVLIEGALRGMFDALDDPHSAYLSAEEMRDLDDTTMGRFGGVGLIISKIDRGVEVVAPIEGTPAYRAGVNAGDLIIAVDGESVVDLNIDEVLSVLRGEPGSSVTMTIIRGKNVRFDVRVVRDMIEVPTVRQDMIPKGIGYLRIIQFTPLTSDRVEDALRQFKEAGYTSLIIDLRSNPGGLLSGVIDIADYFLSKGPIVSTRSRVASENHVFYAASRNTIVPEQLPIVVLIDRGSASASEILAGALQDTGRATIMGEKSYGKGSVQQIKRVGDAGFRLTMSRYYTPLGKNIDQIGISPDVPVQEPEFTEQQEQALSRIIEEELIKDFLSRYPDPTDQDILSFERELADKNIQLDDRYIRRLVRNELNRTNNNPPVYDLEFDLVLREAVNYLGD
ncbi:MAG: S41 family peptidase [Spirochaetaceae bacterium]|nr:MAG: S41 family peptidase [Spirochaetaceae bacterium]